MNIWHDNLAAEAAMDVAEGRKGDIMDIWHTEEWATKEVDIEIGRLCFRRDRSSMGLRDLPQGEIHAIRTNGAEIKMTGDGTDTIPAFFVPWEQFQVDDYGQLTW